MKRTILKTISRSLRLACPIEPNMPKNKSTKTKRLLLHMIAMAILAGMAAAPASSQTKGPNTITGSTPIEMRAPWFNRTHTEVVDEVTLRGSLQFTVRTWASSSTHVDRITIHGNVVDVHGTSETTGQRFRLNGSYSLDLRDPDGTFNPDGTFTLSPQQVTLFLHKVDPEPARLGGSLYGANTWVTAALDGSSSPSVYLGTAPDVFLFSVGATGGSACVIPTVGINLCEVPNGATLFNGYAGDYNPPLYMRMRAYPSIPIRWYCKTGNQEAPVTYVGGEFFRCTPLYSPTDPITVYAVASDNGGYSFKSETRTYRMLERPVEHPPVIDAFSVKAELGPSQGLLARCLPALPCEVFSGDVLFNGQVGDFYPPLYMRLSASDPDGDPVSVQWFCKTGNTPAPITNLGNGVYSCVPLYSSTEPITVYAVVSDGPHNVTSEIRTYTMLERVR